MSANTVFGLGNLMNATVIPLLLLVPLTYLLAPNVWFLLPVAPVIGIVNAGFDITYHTNVVQAAPPGRVLDYATAQSFILGVRGTIAPFLASFLLGIVEPRVVLLVIMALMITGLVMYFRAVREFAPSREAERVPLAEPEPAGF